MTKRTIIAGIAAIALSSVAMAADAAPAVGLAGDKTIVWFDAATGQIQKTAEIEGVDSLIGFDVRPADGKLYGVTGDGTIVTIDTATGAATAGAKLSEMLPDGASGMVDFNPVADRIRVMGTDGTNLRIHPDTGAATVDGKLNFEAGDSNAEATPMVVATAYTNSVGKPEATAMYDIDSGLGALLRQTKPNDGTLATVGMLGIEMAETFAWDIQATSDGKNTAWLAAAGAIYNVNLETGAATKVTDLGAIDGALRDIAILPAM